MEAETVTAENIALEQTEVPQQDPVEQSQEVEKPVEEQPVQEQVVEEQHVEQQVPLSALQKERRKRQEVEIENKVLKEYGNKAQATEPQEPDESQYDPVTKKELGLSQDQIIRVVEERTWIKQNPEKAEILNVELQEFLKQRPNLVYAIQNASNRYEEAWELMDKLSPKQKAALKPASQQKKETPGAPAGIPKAAGINQAVDVMRLSDSDFNAWRQSMRKRR